MTLTLSEAAAFLQSRDKFLLLTHLRPDGDTLGSAGGLCSALRGLGKQAWLLKNPEATWRYARYVEQYWAPEGFTPDCVVSVDVASAGLLQINGTGYAGRVDFAVDHHPSNTGFAGRTLLCADMAACGEAVYELVRLFGDISPETALPLFFAVSTDTGCFQYGNTTAHTHRVAAALIEAGAPGNLLNKRMYRTKTMSRIKIESLIVEALRFYRDGRFCVAPVTLRMIEEACATEEDMDDISTIAGRIEGVTASVTIREMKDGGSKLSIRTNERVDANAIARLLGGGGHAMASGATLPCGMEEAIERLLAAVEVVWPAE